MRSSFNGRTMDLIRSAKALVLYAEFLRTQEYVECNEHRLARNTVVMSSMS